MSDNGNDHAKEDEDQDEGDGDDGLFLRTSGHFVVAPLRASTLWIWIHEVPVSLVFEESPTG